MVFRALAQNDSPLPIDFQNFAPALESDGKILKLLRIGRKARKKVIDLALQCHSPAIQCVESERPMDVELVAAFALVHENRPERRWN